MREIIFDIHLSYEEYQAFYRGEYSQIVVQTQDGRSLQVPANVFQPHLSQEGVLGSFRLLCDENNKMISLEKLPS